LPPWHLGRSVVGQIRSNNFLGRASELAFDFLFALFPLILFMVTIFGLFASRSADPVSDITRCAPDLGSRRPPALPAGTPLADHRFAGESKPTE
jgi:uncharacterized BrkB/YihY/UPF0761 family membrane protein